MLAKVDGRFGSPVSRKIIGRCDDDYSDVWGEPNDRHVLFESSSDANTGIELANDDVTQAVVDHNVEHHPLDARGESVRARWPT